MKQKICHYCNTPAEMMATKCVSCGSPLPVALPMPVAKIVEAQASWSMARTALVTALVTLVLGGLYAFWGSGGISVLMVLWLLLVLPAMLLVSAWMNANRKAGALLGNVLIGVALWVGEFLLLFLPAAFSP